MQLNSHIYRLFAVFDELYEFGATEYFERFRGLDEGYDLYQKALDGVDTNQIKIGIERMKKLENRKRVFPDPRLFKRLCVLSEQGFSEQKYRYEERYLRW